MWCSEGAVCLGRAMASWGLHLHLTGVCALQSAGSLINVAAAVVWHWQICFIQSRCQRESCIFWCSSKASTLAVSLAATAGMTASC